MIKIKNSYISFRFYNPRFMKANALLVTSLVIFLSACSEPDYAPKVQGTYSGSYTNGTNTFLGNVSMVMASKNKVDITVQDSSGQPITTVHNVFIDKNSDDRFDLMNTHDDIGYHITGSYYTSHLVYLHLTHAPGGVGVADFTQDFSGTQQ
jgi:hypothetical protein